MAQIQAEFQEGNRIVFTSRGRSFVNVRELRDDGLIGFSSGELLLIALGNCSLGTLMNHQFFYRIPLTKVTASLHSNGETNPNRISKINIDIQLEIDEQSLETREGTLKWIGDNCPIGNTLRFTPEMEVRVNLKSDGKSQ